MKHGTNSLNIIYLCTSEKGPSGGAKTIYSHSDIINRIKFDNTTSEILHIKKSKISKWNKSIGKVFKLSSNNYYGWNVKDIAVSKNFKSSWVDSGIKLKENFHFNKKKDFVIFPEIFAHFAKKLCIDDKIPYAIFVQNGYCLNPTNNYKILDEVYRKAKFILSYSKDISNCIKLSFNNCEKKILKTNISVDINKFKFKTKKENIISYMPRKLPTHSENLIFFLRNVLPKKWRLKPLHNLSEKDIYKKLLKSKIFLSFSNMEGLGMPPIEAAIAGNKVIGYHGSGGLEYWRKPIFTEIKHGDISNFVNEILKKINNTKMSAKFKKHKLSIIKKYSVKQEKECLVKMIKKIRS